MSGYSRSGSAFAIRRRALSRIASTLAVTCAFTSEASAWTAPPGEGDPPTSIGAFTISGGPAVGRDSPRLELVFLGDPPGEISTDAMLDAMTKAAEAWTSVGCSFVEVGVRGVGQASGLGAGEVPVVFVDPADKPVCFPSGGVRLAAAPCPIGDTVGIALNARDYSWSEEVDQRPLIFGDPTIYALDAVLTHELGHMLGLGHSDREPGATDDDPNLRLATMVGSYLIDGGQATLAADDRRGVCALYPVEGAPECEDAAECASALDSAGATCDATSSPRVCEEERGDIGDYCSSGLLICPGLCLETSAARTGYCTVECDPSSEEACPVGFTCERKDFTDATRNLCVQQSTPTEENSCATAPTRKPGAPLLLALMACGLAWLRGTRRTLRRRVR